MPFIYDFTFPYRNFSFPGKHTEEKVLYATRQHPWLFKWQLFLVISGIVLFDVIVFPIARTNLSGGLTLLVLLALLGFSGLAALFFSWWLRTTYEKTLFIVTNRRLTQFVQTSPFTNYQLSLAFDQVVDTAASTHTYLQRLFGFGSLFARSSAGAQGDFLVKNLQFHHDLHNWLSKLLVQYNQAKEKTQALDGFRPFVPGLKGDARKEFLVGKKW